MMQYNVVYADGSGGVKSASESLSKAFLKDHIMINLINLNDFGDNFIIKSYKGFSRILKLNKSDILILQHFSPIFLGFFLRCLGFKNIINVVHTDLYEYYKNISFLKKIIIKAVFCFLKNQVIVFVSKESEAKAKVRFNLKNTVTIYNVYSCSADKPEIKKLDNKIKLGSISRLNKTKNIDLLIRVFKKVKCTIPNAELLIYGSGDEQEKLEQYIKQQGCADFVKMLGPSNDKDAMYASIDAMVSFSSIEGLPTVILESVGHGVPVFYTDCSSGSRELMAPSTNPLNKTNSYEKTNVGYLVKPVLDVASYSDSLSSYEQEYVGILESFISDVGKQNFSMEYDASPFSEEVVVKKWLEMIGQLN